MMRSSSSRSLALVWQSSMRTTITGGATTGVLRHLVDANATPGIASAGVGIGYEVRPDLEVEATVSTEASSDPAMTMQGIEIISAHHSPSARLRWCGSGLLS